MKKLLTVFVIIIFLTSCSVQENLSPDIFIDRLCASDENVIIDGSNSFCAGTVYTYFIDYAGLPLVAEISADSSGNIKKISLACREADKADLFIECAESVICIFSQEENYGEITDAIFRGKDRDSSFLYHETQWYIYSAALWEEGLFFSTENKKLSPENEEELSLKPNDIVDY